jgi:hypothetical protein
MRSLVITPVYELTWAKGVPPGPFVNSPLQIFVPRSGRCQGRECKYASLAIEQAHQIDQNPSGN